MEHEGQSPIVTATIAALGVAALAVQLSKTLPVLVRYLARPPRDQLLG